MDDDKPFSCSVSNCGMKFVNEDHLVVHRKKHELSLCLTPSSLLKNSFFDQTPTPTKFLNAFDSELFQDLQSDNPFDATFRKANTTGETATISIPESSALLSSLPDTEILCTPSITLTNETDIQTFTVHRHPVSLNKPPYKRKDLDSEEVVSSLPFIPSNDHELSLDIKAVKSNGYNGTSNSEDNKLVVDETSNIDDQEFSDALCIDHGLVVQTPVITSVGNLTKSCATGVPTAVVVTHTSTSDVPNLSSSVSQMSVSAKSTNLTTTTQKEQPSLQPVTVAPVVQLIIRFPDGQAVPVQFPVASTVSEVSTVSIKTPDNISPKLTATSIAKMKLKQVLTSSQKNACLNISSNVNNRFNESNTSSLENLSFVAASPPNSFHRPGSTGRRRRELEDDPEEKRKKSLERNRAAATRCRQKRKHWIQTLGSKADELAATNINLQHEVTMLRNEVTHLKTMLLAHKNCPVTQQQRAAGYNQMLFNENSPVNTYTSQTNCIEAPQSMDIETSSSQSGSVSDISEASIKDR